MVAQQEIEVGIESTACHLGRILHFQCAGCGISWIGKQRFLVKFALFVEAFETCPREQNLATHLKLVGPVAGLELKRHTLDGDDIGSDIVATHTIATRHGTHKAPMLVGA